MALRHHRFRTAAALVAAVFLSTPASAAEVEAVAIPLDIESPETTRLGDLDYAGGLQLSSADRRFGGWSGMVLTPDGRQITAISDNGFALTLDLVRSGERLAGVGAATLLPLAGEGGRALPGDKKLADAESLTRLADGSLAVGFERRHRVLIYPARDDGRTPLSGTPRPLATPPALQSAPENGGLEALLALKDGRLLGFTEELADGDGHWRGWLFAGPGSTAPTRDLALVPTDDYQPTDLAALPDGNLLLLQRRFTVATGPGARLSIVPAAALDGTAPIRDRELAQLTPPLNVDNFEGLATWTDAAGRTRALILSDDNNSFLQRTLLMEFLLP